MERREFSGDDQQGVADERVLEFINGENKNSFPLQGIDRGTIEVTGHTLVILSPIHESDEEYRLEIRSFLPPAMIESFTVENKVLGLAVPDSVSEQGVVDDPKTSKMFKKKCTLENSPLAVIIFGTLDDGTESTVLHSIPGMAPKTVLDLIKTGIKDYKRGFN